MVLHDDSAVFQVATRGNGATTVSATMLIASMVITQLLICYFPLKGKTIPYLGRRNTNFPIQIFVLIVQFFYAWPTNYCRLVFQSSLLEELEECTDMVNIVSFVYLFIYLIDSYFLIEPTVPMCSTASICQEFEIRVMTNMQVTLKFKLSMFLCFFKQNLGQGCMQVFSPSQQTDPMVSGRLYMDSDLGTFLRFLYSCWELRKRVIENYFLLHFVDVAINFCFRTSDSGKEKWS